MGPVSTSCTRRVRENILEKGEIGFDAHPLLATGADERVVDQIISNCLVEKV